MHVLLSLLLLGGIVSDQAAQQESACKDLGSDIRRAIDYHVMAQHATGVAMSEDQHELEWAGRQIREHGKEALPCLVETFHHGLAQAGLWVYESPAPQDSRWVVELIRGIDAPTAITLYREWRTQADDALTRVRITVELASLGEKEFLPEVVAFLEQPTSVPEAERGQVRRIQGRAIQVISFCNYRPALRALQQLEVERPSHANKWLPIYIAQLSGDHEAVFEYTSHPDVAIWALRALRRMGKNDLLEGLAADPKYRFGELARSLLEEKDFP